MENTEVIKLSARSNFSLLGEEKIAQLALDGEIVKVNSLRSAGFTMVKSPVNQGNEPCLKCARKESGILRLWYKVSINCNNVRGDIWICSHCSKVNKTRAGKDLWAELVKSRVLGFTNNELDSKQACSATPYLPIKKDFETAYRALNQLGNIGNLDLILDQIESDTNKAGYTMKINWRMITEENIKIWIKK